jgi:hypothetical protein
MSGPNGSQNRILSAPVWQQRSPAPSRSLETGRWLRPASIRWPFDFQSAQEPIRRDHNEPVSRYFAGVMSLMDQSRLIQGEDNCGQDVVKRNDLGGPKNVAVEEGISAGGAMYTKAIRDIERLLATYGGEAGGWAKMGSNVAHTFASGITGQAHWYENVVTGLIPGGKLSRRDGTSPTRKGDQAGWWRPLRMLPDSGR